MPPQRLDFKAFTHIIWFWGEPTNTYPYFSLTAGSSDSTTLTTGTPGWCLNPLDNGSNGLTHLKIMRDSCRVNGVKLLLCVGGEWGGPASTFAAMVADTLKQNAFIDAATGFARRNGFDGIDIDWEFPDRAANLRALYSRFLLRLRATLDSWPTRGILSAAYPTWFWWNPAHTEPIVEISVMNATHDLVDLMQYGLQNTSQISHYAPLYHNPATNQETMTDRGVIEYKAAGINPSKLVTLIPFECIKMNDNSGISPVALGHAGGGSQWIGLRDIPGSVTVHWDDIAKANWAESGTSFYSYENALSISTKVQFARDQQIGGVGVWELWRGWLPNAPTGQKDPLLQAMKAAVGGFTPPVDSIAPTVSITAPGNGATVSGTVTITANASDNLGVARVEFLVNGVLASTDVSSPYAFAWNANALTGPYVLTARAYDGNGNNTTSTAVAVTVVPPPPDTTLPTVSISSPANGATVSGTVTITATAADNVGVTRVEFFVNGILASTDNTAPYAFAWNASSLNGNYALTAKAYDAAGNSRVSLVVSVFVQPPPPPNAVSLIYQDGLLPPWRDTSWNSVIVYQSTEHIYAGAFSLKATQSAWGAVSERSGTFGAAVDIDPADFIALEFAVYNTTPGLVLNVYCYNDYDDLFPNSLRIDIPLNQWSIINVPMSELNPNNYVIHRVNIQNYTRVTSTYFVDNLHFVDPASVLHAPSLLSPPAGAFVEATSLALQWDTSAQATSYHLQIGGDSLFASIVYEDSDVAGTSKQVGALANYATYFWRVRSKKPGTVSGWSETRRVVFSNPARWKIVSLPYGVADFRHAAVFPTALSPAFAFVNNAGYLIRDTITVGLGYWIRFGLDFQMSPIAYPVLLDTVPLTVGWNLIGSITTPVDVRSITSIPPGVSTSSFFEYLSSAYRSADSIRPGRGYWVKSSQAAQLVIAAGAPSNALGKISMDLNSEMPPPPPGDDIEAVKVIPADYVLDQNFPNPFNPSTTVTFELPKAEHVTLKIYDVLGREVATLVDELRGAGIYQETFNAGRLASGLYFYRLTAGSFGQIRKMMLVK